MITDKEYPATHSMSTAWYMVDADGNVGLMAFDANGPVPKYNQVKPDLGLPDLLFGQGLSEDERCKGIHLDKPQIHELLGLPQKPRDVDLWYEVCLAILPEYTEEFLFLCKNEDITNYGCISSEMNLFLVDVWECVDSDDDNIIKGSTLDKMIKANMIKAIYQMPDLTVNSEFNRNTESVEFTKNFDNAPYYIYCQSYQTSDLQRRMNIPSNPVKIAQIDEKYRKRLLHLPVRFNEAEELQIGLWFVCDTYGQKLSIDDAGYSNLPVDKNTNKYCLTIPFLINFHGYCPKIGHYTCAKCNNECVSTVRSINSLYPTVLYVAAPTRKNDVISRIDLPQEIRDGIAILSYIPKFPYKEPGFWMNLDRVRKHMTAQVLTNLLSASQGWFEKVVRTINPRVIVIDNEALPVFTSVFPVYDNEVLINNIRYPMFKESSVKENAAHITALAQKPYRGKIFRMTYTEQEADNLRRQDKAFEI